MLEKDKIKKSKREYAAFGLVLVALYALLHFYYSKMYLYGDYPPHLEVSRLLLHEELYGNTYYSHIFSYPLYHFVVKCLAMVLGKNYELASIIVLSLFGVAAVATYKLLIDSIWNADSVLKKAVSFVLAIFLLFFETIPCFLTDGRLYMKNCSANPWHNPTITAVRPFGVIAFLLFCLIIKKNEEDNKAASVKEYVAFAVVLFLSLLAKPSYAIVFLPAAGIYTFLYCVKDLKNTWKNGGYLLLAVAPSVIQLCRQFFGNKDMVENTMKFQVGGFSEFTMLQIFKVSIATFPVCILGLVLLTKELKESTELKLAFGMLLFGWIEMFFFTNGPSGDFSWGYDLAVGICTALVLCYVFKNYWLKWKFWLFAGVFTLQCISGISYFVTFYKTGVFWY